MLYRPYQTEAIGSIWNYFLQGNEGNPVVAMPTGTGKSIVIGGFVKSIYESYPRQRVMMLTHVKELIEQNFEKLLKLWPTAPAGIYSSGLGRKEVSKITFGGIQSVISDPKSFGWIDLVIVDECHLVSPNKNTTYQKFLNALMQVNPGLKVVGLSATPYRLGQGLITDGGIFTDVCFDITGFEPFNRLLNEAYLSQLIPKKTSEDIDLSGVRIQGGEFNNKDLQGAIDRDEITYRALQESIHYGQNRKHWLVFTTGVHHTESVAAALDSMGISAVPVHNKLTPAQRVENIQGFMAGKYRAIVNNNILTTGFDFPGIDLIVNLRPTNSPGLWVQMMGRGTRPVYHPAYSMQMLQVMENRIAAIQEGPKQNCLVLDFAKNTARLGPINDPKIPKKKGKGGGVAPVKLCEHCGTINHSSVRFCIDCGQPFPIDVKFGMESSNVDIIKTAKDEPKVSILEVSHVTYHKHTKVGRPDSLLVNYHCGLRRFKTFICLEHGGIPARKAEQWWREAWPAEKGDLVPTTVDEALKLASSLNEPTRIRVWVNKKPYPEVLTYEYDGKRFDND